MCTINNVTTIRPRCSVDDCTNRVKARDLCDRHYHKARTAGRICRVGDCGRPLYCRDLCSVHYNRWLRSGDPGEAALRRNPARPCKVQGCTVNAKSLRDLCSRHAQVKLLYGDENGSFRTHKFCLTCGNPAVAGWKSKDYCRSHYVDYVKSLVIQGEHLGDEHPSGYVYVNIFKKRYAEHAIVMEHMLGRPLRPGESVHHKNGRRGDNRPGNLELWVKPQLAGQRVEDLVSWVVDTYPEFVRAELEGRPQLFVA